MKDPTEKARKIKKQFILSNDKPINTIEEETPNKIFNNTANSLENKQANNTINTIANQLLIKKKFTKKIYVQWPGTLFQPNNYIEVSGTFSKDLKLIPSHINKNTDIKLLPDGYSTIFIHYEYLKEHLFKISLNFLQKKSFIENIDAFGRPNFCFEEIFEHLEFILLNFKYSDIFNFESQFDDLINRTHCWSNVGLLSGSWDNFKTFVNKRSLIIENDLFLISHTSNDLNSILFHPFISKESISIFQKQFFINENYI